MTAGRSSDEQSFTGADQFTADIAISKGERFTVSIDGTFTATVTFQRRLNGSNWREADSWTAPAERDGIAAENMEIRLGIKAGQHSSGTAVCRIGK